MSDRSQPLEIRGMPRSDYAEEGVISCLLNQPQTLDFALGKLPEECFYHVGNRLLFTEILALHTSDRRSVTPVTLAQWLLDRQTMDRIGGPAIIAERFNYNPTPESYRNYTGILRGKLKLRQIINACTATIEDVYSNLDEPDECLASLSTRVMELESQGGQKFRLMPELVQAALDRYQEAAALGGQLPGIPTGYNRLDMQTGGMMPCDMWVIAGGTSDGKSAFAETLVHEAVMRDHPCAIYTFEMSDDKTTDRLFAIDAEIDNSCFKRGTFKNEDMGKLTRSAQKLRAAPIYIRDVSGMKLGALLADMRTLKRQYKVKVFMIDYGQLIRPDSKGHNREAEVAVMSGAMKAAAKSLKATIILLSQLNDDGKLRESRAIGYDADIVVTLSVPQKTPKKKGEDTQKDETRRVLFFGKNRDGERGKTINYHFHGPTYRFTEEVATTEET